MRKPGYLTSEFWLVTLTFTLTNLGALQVPTRYTWIANLGLVVGYALARSIVKFGDTAGDPPPVHPEEVAATAAQRRALEQDLKRAEGDREGAK